MNIVAVVIVAPLLHGAQISGRIVDSSGKAIPNVTVVASFRGADKQSPRSATARSAADGSFSVPDAPAGSYRLCVPSHPGFLDPCKWSDSVPGGTVNPSGPTSVPAVVLENGTNIEVQAVDDTGALAKNEGKIPGAHLLVGVFTPAGLFVPLAVTRKDSQSQTYTGYVPFEKKVRLSVTGAAFSLTDSSGKPLKADGSLGDLQVKSGKGVDPVVIHVKGLQ